MWLAISERNEMLRKDRLDVFTTIIINKRQLEENIVKVDRRRKLQYFQVTISIFDKNNKSLT